MSPNHTLKIMAIGMNILLNYCDLIVNNHSNISIQESALIKKTLITYKADIEFSHSHCYS